MTTYTSIIPTKKFGRSDHLSTRTIFGAAAFSEVTQYEADKTFELLNAYGVNHIDTARSYGDAELRIGPWMKTQRKNFFLATKTNKRTKKEALRELYESLERLQTDYIDLWQMHFLVDPGEWNTALNTGGAIEAFIEAREKGLVRFLGVTGHGVTAPAMHIRSLNTFDFDTVLFPYNFMMMKNPEYAEKTKQLLDLCREKNIAVQTIKSIAKREAKEDEKAYATWYEPLAEEKAIQNSVQWVLKNSQVFLNTAGDIHLLPTILEAAKDFTEGPTEEEMEAITEEYKVEPLFH